MVGYRSHLPPLLGVILLALAVRVPVAAWRMDSLQDDRDHYRLLAQGLVQTGEFTHPDHGTPTAYRPPLYPLLLAAVLWTGAGDVGVAGLHLLLGLATVALTLVTGLHLGLSRRAWWPAAAVAVDPLLVVGATLPMTETLFAALAMGVLAVVSSPAAPSGSRGLLLGILFGLAALCRPSVWAFAAVLAVVAGVARFRKRTGPDRSRHPLALAATLAGIALCIGPWLGRNLAVSGTPVLTSTHGGYTLLLGNNPDFYDQVVRRPLGTTWNDKTSDPGHRPGEWRERLEARLPTPPRGIQAERQRDRFMYRLALAHAADDPGGFARACLLRVLRFWTPWPLESAPGSAWPTALKWAVATWYAAAIVAMLVGLCRAPWTAHRGWQSPLLLLLALSLVHVVFWSTMRMRAPVMPVVFLLGTVGVCGKPAREAESETAAAEAY